MADAMQGIMSLPPEMGGMETAPRSFLTPEDENTLNQLRSSVSSQEFSSEMFNAAEQADPQSVMQLRMMLQGLQLPPELIDLLRQMVDKLLAEPNNYQENRQKFLAEGVPEDLLPPDFDPSFFVALNMALDQVSGSPVQGFAAGGMAMNPIAGGIAGLGRYGDTMLAHITPQEAMMLRRQGGAGSINPVTGLPEFFNIFKEVGNAFKRAGDAVVGAVKDAGSAIKRFAKSSVGRMITGIAIAYFLGPLAAQAMFGAGTALSAVSVGAVSGFLGGAGSTLLAGGSIKDALRDGAVGGIIGGAGSFATQGGTAAFQAGSYTGPTTLSGLTKQATSAFTPGAAQAGIDDIVTPGTAALDDAGAGASGRAPTGTSNYFGDAPRPNANVIGQNIDEVIAGVDDTAAMTRLREIDANRLAQRQAAERAVTDKVVVGPNQGFSLTDPKPPLKMARFDSPAYARALDVADEPQGIMSLVQKGKLKEAGQQAFQGAKQFGDDIYQGTKNVYKEYFSPAGLQQQGAEASRRAGMQAYEEALRLSGDKLYAAQVAKEAAAAALPSTLSSYLPLAAAGTGAAYLGGAFDVPEPPKPDIPVSGELLYRRNPYLLTPKIRTISASTGQPYRYAAGGIADLAGGTSKYPRKNGPINGPGTGTSDSIPAMLSDGEFVFTAKAVRAMGKGSRRKGAKRMYALMKALEKRT
jgi:hypothetical protein